MRLLAATAAAGLVAACAIPTDACGCSPPPTIAFVRGTVVDSAGRPVVDAGVWLEGAPADRPPGFPAQWVGGPPHARTDGAGAFAGRAVSGSAPGVLALRVAVVRGAGDTVRVVAGPATFRLATERLDTVRVALRLP